MAKIIVNRENFQVDEIDLQQGTLNIGRTSDNDLVIDDLTVSGRHAKIVSVFNSTYVEDLGSTNGTYVNGKRVQTLPASCAWTSPTGWRCNQPW